MATIGSENESIVSIVEFISESKFCINSDVSFEISCKAICMITPFIIVYFYLNIS